MAQRVQVQLIDDLDESEASETVKFSLDGATYEIDLNEHNASELRDALAPYVTVARRSGRSAVPAPRRGGRTTATREVDPKAVREWARAQGLQVNDRGRVPAEILENYRAAH